MNTTPATLYDPQYEGVEITIFNADAPTAPDLPSHLFPGCGSGGADFRVTAGAVPENYSDMDNLLYHTIPDCCLIEYDPSSGKGYFRVVDDDAPAAGTVIKLANPFADSTV